MRILASLIAGGLLAAALFAATPSPAGADVFQAIGLASARATPGAPYEQAGEAKEPVISGDARYVAFVGSFGGVPGIWRRDLETGVVEQVAGGNATLPSISADGRYVSFTTNQRLLPGQDGNRAPDVYRRDMSIECTSEGRSCQPCPEGAQPETPGCPFALVSAVNGSDEGAEYIYPGPAAPGTYTTEQEEQELGSLASGRSAMSADGRYVAFITTTSSDLLGHAETTPPLEVLVRDMATHETKLVSAEYGTGTPVQTTSQATQAYGAVYPGGNQTPIFIGELTTPWLGASISADGSSVAWLGQEIGRQARMLGGEQSQWEAEPESSEPLWRRIAEPVAPTRRVTGGSDPEDPLCPPTGERQLPNPKFPSPLDPCAGPFGFEPHVGAWNGQLADFVPQLSANGTTVAFLTGAREVAGGELGDPLEEAADDLYVVDMTGGLTRLEAIRRLTAKGGISQNATEDLARAGLISDLSVSADGSQVAFTTQRTIFPLGSPADVSPTAAIPGMSELFDVDLGNETLTRVTHGFGGEDEPSEQPHKEFPGSDPYGAHQGAFSPSFSTDGDTLSFSSTADNLVFGDGNAATDAFVVRRRTFPAQTVTQYVSPAPPAPALEPPWRLGVTAVSRTDGSVLLYAEVPGAGSLAASAKSTLHVRVRVASRRAHGHHQTTTALATRVVAGAKVASRAGGEGLQTLTLTLSPSYRALATSGGGLSSLVDVAFTAPGRRALRVSLRVTFKRVVHPAKKRTGHAAARAKPSSTRR